MTDSNDSNLFGNNDDLYAPQNHYDEFEPFVQALPLSLEPLFPATSVQSGNTQVETSTETLPETLPETQSDSTAYDQSYGGQIFGDQSYKAQNFGAAVSADPLYGEPVQPVSSGSQMPVIPPARQFCIVTDVGRRCC